ncbi:MAG: hypothetical protein J6573_00225 [Lactobacillus sp.]|nr:hypothetical protein [Lactobacillus sp.]
MADLFDGKRNISLDTSYNMDYEAMNAANLGIANIFFLALIIGKRNNTKIAVNDHKGKEFRPSYFTPLQKDLIYGLVLNLTGSIPVDDKEITNIYDELIAYANGGIQWMRNNVFFDCLNDNSAINIESQEIIVRLNQMIYDELNPQQSPF